MRLNQSKVMYIVVECSVALSRVFEPPSYLYDEILKHCLEALGDFSSCRSLDGIFSLAVFEG
jgi:hypothetical protein